MNYLGAVEGLRSRSRDFGDDSGVGVGHMKLVTRPNPPFFHYILFAIVSFGYMSAWTSLGSLISYYKHTYGTSFYTYVTCAYYLPGLPVSLLQFWYDDYLDFHWGSRNAYVARGALSMVLMMFVIISMVWIKHESTTVFFFVLLGICSWLIHGSASQLSGLYPSEAVAFLQTGFRSPEVFTLAATLTLGIGRHPDSSTLGKFFTSVAGTVFLGLLAWICLVTSKYAKTIFDDLDRLNKVYFNIAMPMRVKDGHGHGQATRSGNEDRISEKEEEWNSRPTASLRKLIWGDGSTSTVHTMSGMSGSWNANETSDYGPSDIDMYDSKRKCMNENSPLLSKSGSGSGTRVSDTFARNSKNVSMTGLHPMSTTFAFDNVLHDNSNDYDYGYDGIENGQAKAKHKIEVDRNGNEQNRVKPVSKNGNCSTEHVSVRQKVLNYNKAAASNCAANGSDGIVRTVEDVSKERNEVWTKVKPLCVALFLTMSTSVFQSAFFAYCKSPHGRNIEQILYFTRLFSDLAGRPLSLLPRPMFIRTPQQVVSASYARLILFFSFFIYVFAPQYFFFLPQNDVLICVIVGIFSVINGYFAVIIYEYASNEVLYMGKTAQNFATALLNITFQFSAFLAVLCSILVEELLIQRTKNNF